MLLAQVIDINDQKVIDRFWSRVYPEPMSGCWLWGGALSGTGYGQFYYRHPIHGKTWRSTHRVAYTLAVGPIPTNLTLDHLCRNRACVNPDHLEPVTHKTNIKRAGVNGAAATHSQKSCCPRCSGPFIDTGKQRICKPCNHAYKLEWQRRKLATDPGYAARRREGNRNRMNAKYRNDPKYAEGRRAYERGKRASND